MSDVNSVYEGAARWKRLPEELNESFDNFGQINQ